VRLLIVDDEADIRDSLAEFFEDKGHEVAVAANGAEAWHRLATEPIPDVVVLDLTMPVLDGNALHARMRSDPRLANVRVIIATSDPARAPAGVPTLTKPIDLERLAALVERDAAPLGA
jgi:CheY-like chemotaxis protein